MSKQPHTNYDKSDSEIEDLVNRQMSTDQNTQTIRQILINLGTCCREIELRGIKVIRPFTEEQLEEHAQKLERYCEKKCKEIEKAYGGCRKCYGKGYATYSNTTTAFADFGDELGGADSATSTKLEMRFCACDRGKQLEQLQKGGK